MEGKGEKETDLVFVGYNYNKKKAFRFVTMKGEGSITEQGPYEVFSICFNNVFVHQNDRPDLISDYFNNLCFIRITKRKNLILGWRRIGSLAIPNPSCTH